MSDELYELKTPIWMGYSEPSRDPMYLCPYCDSAITGAVLVHQHYDKHEVNHCPHCEKIFNMKWEEV